MDDKEIIKNFIDEQFKLKEKLSDWKLELKSKLLFAQLGLFQTLASIMVALVGVGYILETPLNSFSYFSLFTSIFSLIIITSYTREKLDEEEYSCEQTTKSMEKDVDGNIEFASVFLKENKSELFYNYCKEKSLALKAKEIKVEIGYIGEIMLSLFYTSLFFFILSIFNSTSDIREITAISIIVILLSILISFCDWSVFLLNRASKVILLLDKNNRLKKILEK